MKTVGTLAQGFLSGKYRLGGPHVDSARAGMISGYLDQRGVRVRAALDDIAALHAVSVAAVALAWLAAQPTVLAPVASARTREQLTDLNHMTNVTLSTPELERLRSAATPTPWYEDVRCRPMSGQMRQIRTSNSPRFRRPLRTPMKSS